jgi:pyrimidine-nucleoside phosphorylase
LLPWAIFIILYAGTRSSPALAKDAFMGPVDILRKKRDGGRLSADEIGAFVRGVTDRSWPDYQAAALLMAIVLRGMDADETAQLTRAMVASGEKLDFSDLPGPKVDKHSTGGVGDKTSLILAPLVAACGVYVPMMSGRGLGHTGGTLDKLEAIPGFRVHLSLDEFRATLKDIGCALIGATKEIAPADKILYALRDVTATVESIPLITASILSKKVAEGINALVMDVKCGNGAFMKNHADAKALAQSLVANGNANGVKTEALITRMEAPLGVAIGNALEVQECIDILAGKITSGDLRELSLDLAARMVALSGKAADLADARTKIDAALSSGSGLEKFRQIIIRQGGDAAIIEQPTRLPIAKKRHVLKAERGGFITAIHAESFGRACMMLGAGRSRVEDVVDPAVGAILLAQVGQEVHPGDPLADIHYQDGAELAAAQFLFEAAITVGEAPPAKAPLVLETLS